jgi:hypothetical protein
MAFTQISDGSIWSLQVKKRGQMIFILKLNPLSDVFVLLIVEKVLSEGLHS